ncbi:MAG: glycosyltransferase family 2 protein [Chloroflexota bacterium]
MCARQGFAKHSCCEAQDTGDRILVSIVTPAYNEADNLPPLYKRLCSVTESLNLDWEWVVVDDHSTDDTFKVLTNIAQADARVRGIRLSRNSGSHIAITCGLQHSRGDCGIIMAADMQDPPETLPLLLAEWNEGAQVVWAVRNSRDGERATTLLLARLYYYLMRRFVGIGDMPSTGADFLLVDRRVMDALSQFGESNVSLLALITWMGFRQAVVGYGKQARRHGRSGWTLEKKLKLALDSITSFSYFPIRLMSYIGFVVALFGFLYAGLVILNALSGNPTQGWSSLMVAVLLLGGVQMMMMGVLGEYLWRALDETRRRPRYLIESDTNYLDYQ